MKRFLLICAMVCLVAASLNLARAAAVETADLTGTGGAATAHHGVTAITDALAAVSDGGTVQITEAGTYNLLTLIGGKSYTIQGMVTGVIVGGSLNTGTGPSLAMNFTGGAINCTLKNFTVLGSNAGNANGTWDFTQDQGTPTQITMDHVDITVDQSQPTLSQRAVYIRAPTVAVPANNMTFTNCSFTGGPNGGNSFNFTAASPNYLATNVSFTNCTFNCPKSEAIWFQEQPALTASFSHCSISAPTSLAFKLRGPLVDKSLTLSDCTVQFATYAMEDDQNAGTALHNSQIIINRCTFDKVTYGATTNANNIFNFNHTVAATGTAHMDIFNSVIIDSEHPSSQTNNVINVNGMPVNIEYCTILAAGNGSPNGITVGTTGGTVNIVNSILGNFITAPVTGAVGTSSHNLVVGPADSTALGTHTYVSATAGIANATTAIKLDPATYVPLSGSQAINAADPSATYLTAIGGLDRRGNSRSDGQPDIGALEYGATPAPTPTPTPRPVNPVKGFTNYY